MSYGGFRIVAYEIMHVIINNKPAYIINKHLRGQLNEKHNFICGNGFSFGQ